MNSVKTDKETVCKFLKRLNTELQNVIAQMKVDFEKNPPEANGIKQKLMSWKSKYTDLVSSNLKEFIIPHDMDESSVDFKEFLAKITEDYGSEQEFLDNLKYLNTSIEGLKDFIRVNLIKDPSVYYIK